jgi:hypothetical protein
VNPQIIFKSDKKKAPAKRKKKRDLKFLREFFKIVAVVCIAAVVFYRFILPSVSPTKNLTGNQSALAMCEWELAAWKSYEANQRAFDFHKLSDDQKRRIIMNGLSQDFLIKTNFIWGNDANREIVIVCMREFDNVPVPAPWNALYRNPAHAVGYSDGTRGLISPEQFSNLFTYGMVSLWSLATNSDSHFKIFKQ